MYVCLHGHGDTGSSANGLLSKYTDGYCLCSKIISPCHLEGDASLAGSRAVRSKAVQWRQVGPQPPSNRASPRQAMARSGVEPHGQPRCVA
jgi:hypothetical protein